MATEPKKNKYRKKSLEFHKNIKPSPLMRTQPLRASDKDYLFQYGLAGHGVQRRVNEYLEKKKMINAQIAAEQNLGQYGALSLNPEELYYMRSGTRPIYGYGRNNWVTGRPRYR